MKSSGVIALVAAGVVAGGGVATYELTKPSGEPLQVNYVSPASTPTTASVTPTKSAPKPTATATTATSSASSPVTSNTSTTRKATVRKEATVANDPAPAPSTSSATSANTPPADSAYGSMQRKMKQGKPHDPTASPTS